ncbi:membrane dipeptidase [Paenibacillus donghaensis]|uniref:Uncharacterized protein n=1 Tax=Paenibacillus donghaensis TaxID=414771 RepID=A0A2Z2KST8_9BACL|nr:hypothetical protein B9T62_24785 [Paenibacillus donghaensis]
MKSGQEGFYDFKLTMEEESRASKLHEENINIDLLFQGPLSPLAIPAAVSDRIKALCEPYREDPMLYSSLPGQWVTKLAASGEIPEYQSEWVQSGITAGNRQLNLRDTASMITSMGEVQLQFDSADWLVKTLKADDIRAAKREGRKAGIISAQETDALGTNLAQLDDLHHFGLRML